MTGFNAIIQDITKRVKATETVLESEEKFRNIFERAKDSIILLDKTGKILDVNEEAVKIFAGSKEELIRKHFRNIGVLSPKDILILLKNFTKVLQNKSILTEMKFINN